MWPLPAAARLGPARAPTELWVHHPGSPQGCALLPGGKWAPGKVLQKVTFKLTRFKHSRWLINGVMLVCTLTSMYKYSSNLHEFENINLYLISSNQARSIYDEHYWCLLPIIHVQLHSAFSSKIWLSVFMPQSPPLQKWGISFSKMNFNLNCTFLLNNKGSMHVHVSNFLYCLNKKEFKNIYIY